MITVNVTPDGEITISSEPVVERRQMHSVYADEDATTADEKQEAFFKQGWDAAVRESQLRFVHGQLLDFYNEQQTVDDNAIQAAQQHADIYGEQHIPGTPSVDWSGSWPITGDELPADAHAIKPVVDSGEPDEEKNQTWDPENTGTWTMSSEELQSRLDAAYTRGFEQRYQVTSARVRILARELNSELFADGYGVRSKEEVLTEFGIALLGRLGIEVTA